MKNSFHSNPTRALREKSYPIPQNLSARKIAQNAAMAWAGLKFLCGGKPKDFEVNRVQAEEIARSAFAKLLRDPFPALSDQAIAAIWAKRLGRSEQTVLNWLRCSNSAPIEDVYVVATMHGVWETARIMVGDLRRTDLLEQMAQK